MSSGLPGTDVLHHIVDVHCHPTDASEISADAMENLSITICAMSSMESDQAKVRALAVTYPGKVVPCFGYHPWFSHLISTTSANKEQHYRNLFLPHETSDEAQAQFLSLLPLLPDPRPLTSVLAELRENLLAFPNAMVGEVGLDRVFRVPIDYFATPRVLTSFTIPLDHQITLLEAQLDLAIELERNVSVHSVKSQQATLELFSKLKAKHGPKWNRISIDMHSCGLNPQTWRDFEKKYENVFLSLSTVINQKHANHRALIAECSPNRILAESDYNDVSMCTTQTWDMIKIIAEIKAWTIETHWSEDSELEEKNWGVVRRLERNWIRFKEGRHQVASKGKDRKRREYFAEDSEADE